MAPKDNLFRRLKHLDQAGSAERQAARQRRQQQNSAEILQTFLAYRLADAAEKMALGIAIGDPLTLRHEPTNEWDPNAVKVFWKNQWIGYIPKDMAALLAAEVPEAASGLDAVVTGLTTTSLRDAFRLQISIPISKASRRLKELGISSAFAWDFDRTSGADKMRLVINCTEASFRELQELLRSSYDVSKCGYSYYPTQDGRHYPWYLSLTDTSGRAPRDEDAVEQLIRSLFGVPSESTRRRERQERLERLESKQEDISQRLATSRADEARLRQELENSRREQEKRTQQAVGQKERAVEQAERIAQELSITRQELDLALKENETFALAQEELATTLAQQQEELAFFYELSEGPGFGMEAPSALARTLDPETEALRSQRLLDGLQATAASMRPRRILELMEALCPESIVILESAWKSADEAAGFELGDRLFQLLWRLATTYREARLAGQPDVAGIQVFGSTAFAARESNGIEKSPAARRARTFSYNGADVVMWQHLKIGVKDSVQRTLRIHFIWDPDTARVVIGHCGKHLPVPGR
jgi:type II secretory pathway pseudopilin PulG